MNEKRIKFKKFYLSKKVLKRTFTAFSEHDMAFFCICWNVEFCRMIFFSAVGAVWFAQQALFPPFVVQWFSESLHEWLVILLFCSQIGEMSFYQRGKCLRIKCLSNEPYNMKINWEMSEIWLSKLFIRVFAAKFGKNAKYQPFSRPLSKSESWI